MLTKTYFGGGTVDVSLATCDFHVYRQRLCDRCLYYAFYFLSLLVFYFDYMFVDVLKMAGLLQRASVSKRHCCTMLGC